MKQFLIAVLLIVSAQLKAQQTKTYLSIGDDAPAFKVAYWLKGNPGGGVEKGKVNIVEFWATWCAPCLANIPHLSKISKDYEYKNVKVFGISINERKTVDVDSLRRFISTEKGQGMNYIVGADDSSKYMSTYWHKATGQQGIPFAMIIDRNGKIAWLGHPATMEKALDQIVENKWDLTMERKKYFENKRLDSIDMSNIRFFNEFIGLKKFKEGLSAMDSLLLIEPGLKYKNYTSHFMMVFLFNIDPAKAVSFVRATWDANEIPNWKDVSDYLDFLASSSKKLPTDSYWLAFDALQAQINHYPWAMDAGTTYDKMANFVYLAGDKAKAEEFELSAIEAVKKKSKIDPEQLASFEIKLKEYRN